MSSRDIPSAHGAVSSAAAAPESRVLSIDRYRGALIVLMVVANYLGGIAAVPAFVKHTPDVGLTIVDVGAPCFVFAIGLTYGRSFRRRAGRGLRAAYGHFLLRYLALVGVGAILSSGGTQVAGEPSDWGVLQALGVAGLVCLPFIRLGTTMRFVIGAVLLLGYQALLDVGALDAVRASVQGGLIGGLSWGALLILSTAVADLWRRGTRPMVLCCAALTCVAIVAALVVPVSKTRVSLSYVLVSLAVAAVGFLLIDLLSRALPGRAGVVTWWGQNALVLYLLHLLLLGLVVLPEASWWYVDASAWLAGLQLLAILGILTWAAWWLHRRGIRLRM